MEAYARNSIRTHYIGATNHRGSRIAASCDGRKLTVPYDHAASRGEGPHVVAAIAWLEKYIPGAKLDPRGLSHAGDYYWTWTY